ncbi:putative ribonuclease H-like domain-containing protein [Tanacetum coccineum]
MSCSSQLCDIKRSGLRKASAAAKPCQGDSLEFYLITSRIPDGSSCCFRNFDVCYHDPEKCEHAGPMVTTLHGGNTPTRMIKRFTRTRRMKEVFAPVARIEAIRLFLAYASFKDFVVYQMDVKSAFLYGKIEEEVYVCQPLGFEDPDFPNKVEKALYGSHQAPRVWYETLSTYLLDNGFQRGKIDKTLFIRRVKSDILLVQVYVDDIIFGSTKKSLCIEFEKMMHKKFQMSSMGELTFFLGLQVKQKEDGIFINQDKYVTEILKKFSFTDVKTASTPMETHKPLLKDADGEDVDEHLYRSMIGSLMYLTSSRPDIMFAVCACARFQVNPKSSHLHAVKRIFRYLKGQPKLGLWYPKDSPFDLVAYTDSDYALSNLRVDTLGSGEDRLSLKELMDLCTKLSDRVLDLETTKTVQAKEIASLKKRVKKLERKMKSKTPGMKRLFKIGRSAQVVSSKYEGLGNQEDASKHGRKIADIDVDAEVILIDETQGRNDDNLMFDTSVLDEQEFEVEKVVSTAEVTTASATTTTTINKLTLAQTLIEIKAAKPKDKGKAKMIESEKPLKKKDQIMYDQELLSYKGSTDPKHLGPTSGIRATRGTLSKKNHKNNKHSLSRSRKMSHPADEFSQHLSDDDVSNHEDASDNGDATNKPKQQQLISTATTISNIKLPILKKEEYDIWAMEMEHYLEYIDNDVWKVIQNGNSKKRISTGKDGVIRVLPPVSAAEIHAVEKERKARTILLMAIPKEHLRRFHGMDDAKEIWEAIRTRFGGNANSKKMQKALEAHGAEVLNEDANHKFLKALPLAWSNLTMTMRTKPEIDTLSIDDLSSTNKVKFGLTSTFSPCNPSTSSSNIPEREATAGFTDEVIYSLFAKQSKDLDLLHEDLEQIDDVDIEEMDINWQIAMIAI